MSLTAPPTCSHRQHDTTQTVASRAAPRMQIWSQADKPATAVETRMRGKLPPPFVLAGLSSSLRSVQLSTPWIWRSIASPAVQQLSSPSQTDRHSPRHGNQLSHPNQKFKNFRWCPLRSGWPQKQKQVQPASETTKKTFTSTPSQHKQTHHDRTKTKLRKSRQNSRKAKSCYDSCMPLRAALTS